MRARFYISSPSGSAKRTTATAGRKRYTHRPPVHLWPNLEEKIVTTVSHENASPCVVTHHPLSCLPPPAVRIRRFPNWERSNRPGGTISAPAFCRREHFIQPVGALFRMAPAGTRPVSIWCVCFPIHLLFFPSSISRPCNSRSGTASHLSSFSLSTRSS